MFIKTGDKVRVIAGKDKGKEGTIKKVLASQNRVIVEGVNIVKKHHEPTRLGYKFVDGKKVRVAKKSGKTLD